MIGRVIRALLGVAVLGGLVLCWLLVQANLFGPGPIPRERIEPAIHAGLDWLDASDRYTRLAGDNGVFPIEVWITRQVLAEFPHPGLEADIRRGWQRLLASPRRFWAKFPGEPERRLRPIDRKVLEAFIGQDFLGKAGVEGARAWDRWFLYAAYPETRHMIKGDFDGMLSEHWSVSFGYELSHRLYAYRMFQRQSPEVAAEYDMAALEERAMATMLREMHLDFRLYDLYYERVAFYLERVDDPAEAPGSLDRWIERILDAQNADGSWNSGPSLGCDLVAAFGLDCERGTPGYHPTFLALHALAQYQALHEGRR